MRSAVAVRAELGKRSTSTNRRAGMIALCLTLILLIGPGGPGLALGCPNCKEAVTSSEGQVASTSTGYNWSVIFMLGVPFSMLGTGMLVVRRAVKRGLLPEM